MISVRKKIYFRADSSAQIGYGHFVRTLALIDILREEYECVLFTQKPTEYQINECKNLCKLVPLMAGDENFDEFLSFLSGEEIVVLDNYFFDTSYQQQIKDKGCKLVCIDGMTTKHYVADVLICQSLDVRVENFSVAEYTKVYTGLEYSLLRKPFFEAVEKKIDRGTDLSRLRVLAAFGGTDYYDLTSKFCAALQQMDFVQSVDAIIGDAHVGISTKEPKVIYHKNLSAEQMVHLFWKNDVAILPSSTILKEALYCRTPVVSGYFVDNQVGVYKTYVRSGLVSGIGNFTLDESINLLCSTLKTGAFLNNKKMDFGQYKTIDMYRSIFQQLI